jgi:hypothetical protein
VSKAFLKTLLHTIPVEWDLTTMQPIIAPIKTILMEVIPNYREIIDPAIFPDYEKIADAVIMYMLNISPQDE